MLYTVRWLSVDACLLNSQSFAGGCEGIPQRDVLFPMNSSEILSWYTPPLNFRCVRESRESANTDRKTHTNRQDFMPSTAYAGGNPWGSTAYAGGNPWG